MTRNNGGTTADPASVSSRNSDGTFAPGNAGRPAGSRHKATLAAIALLEGEAEALGRKAIEMALAGDIAALRLCLERIAPQRKDAPVTIELPTMRSARDAAEAMQVVVAAVGQGELTPLEATSVVGLIDAFRRTLELTEIEERVAELERMARGPA